MLDEVYECIIVIDVLFVLLKKIMKSWKDFKVIVISVMLDVDKFSEYFNVCFIFIILG